METSELVLAEVAEKIKDRDDLGITMTMKKTCEMSNSSDKNYDTEDELNDEDLTEFLHLMDEAGKRNECVVFKANHEDSVFRFGGRYPENMSDTDTEDEMDPTETRKFLSLMERLDSASMPGVVKLKLGEGKVLDLPRGLLVTRVPQSEEERRRHQEEKMGRRKNHLEVMRRESHETITRTPAGKRKFKDRMTLNEAKAEDFTDTKDYVDFIQTKLQNINIRMSHEPDSKLTISRR